MPFGLTARASLKKKRLIGSAVIATPDQVADAILDGTKGTPLDGLASSSKLGGARDFLLSLHPAGEPIHLESDGGSVKVSASTESAGPGYHAFLVGILDAVQTKLGLVWEWSAMDDDIDYAMKRDFPALQARMAQLFKDMCKKIADEAAVHGTVGMRVYMPEDFIPGVYQSEILTPLGPRKIEELQRWAALDGAALNQGASEFYAWWDQGFEGNFYRGLASYAMWMKMRWAKPLDDPERKTLLNTLRWLDEAVQRNAPPPITSDLINEIKTLAVSGDAPDFPEEKGIGYRRRKHLKALGGNWRARVPGSLEQRFEDDGTTVFWNDVIKVRVSVGVVSADSAPTQNELQPGQVEMERGFSESDDGKGFLLQNIARTPSMQGPDRICLMTVWMADVDLRGLAEKIADSVTCAEPRRA